MLRGAINISSQGQRSTLYHQNLITSRGTVTHISTMFHEFLVRDAFVRTNGRAIAVMFVRPSVCPSWTDVHCDHTVHASIDLSLWLDSPMFWVPRHQSTSTYSLQPFFPV